MFVIECKDPQRAMVTLRAGSYDQKTMGAFTAEYIAFLSNLDRQHLQGVVVFNLAAIKQLTSVVKPLIAFFAEHKELSERVLVASVIILSDPGLAQALSLIISQQGDSPIPTAVVATPKAAKRFLARYMSLL